MPGAPQSKSQRSVNNLKAKIKMVSKAPGYAVSRKSSKPKRLGLREIARAYRPRKGAGDNGD